MSNHRPKTGGELLLAERGTYFDRKTFGDKKGWDPRGVDQHIVMPFVVPSPRTIVAADKCRHLSDIPIRRWQRESGDDGPVVTDTPHAVLGVSSAPFEITDVDGQNASGAHCPRQRHQ